MKAQRVNKYRKYSEKLNDFVTVYVYKVVQATPQELEDYETTQAENFVADDEDGLPLFFSPQFEGNMIELVKAKSKNKDGDLVSAYRPVSSEDFELKRTTLEAKSQPATLQTLKPLIKKESISVLTAAVTTEPTDAVDTDAVDETAEASDEAEVSSSTTDFQ